MVQYTRFRYLLLRRARKAQENLLMFADSPELSLLLYAKYDIDKGSDQDFDL